MKLTCRLHEIADSLRKATGSKKKFNASEFANDISKLCYVSDDVNGQIPIIEGGEILPTREPIILTGNHYIRNDIVIRGDKTINRQFITQDLLNEYYGLHVADVARGYHLAKVNGTAQFRYSQSKGIWSEKGLLTDEEGRCYLDCSGFVALVLRGIEFQDTPYYKAKGEPHKYLSDYGLDNSVIYDLCVNSKHSWANKYLDKQKDETLKDIGLCKYYSVRNASQIAEYYYSHGKVIHEFQESPKTLPSGMRAGDLIFWAKPNAGEHQKERFRSISHVGIVGRDTSRYYQVTGYVDERVTETIFHTELLDNLEHVCLILRPNYVPFEEVTPIGMNLLTTRHFDSCGISASITKNGVEISPLVEGGFNLNRISSSSSGFTFYIAEKDKPIRLHKGKYKLSGAPTLSENSVNVRDWGLMVKRTDGEMLLSDGGHEVLDKGEGDTFTLNKTTEVYVCFYGGGSLEPNNLVCKPKLERIS